ncbi:transcriptional regulator [Rodentibacter pneumotropicus]|uniref:helix-turn-helix domain-containing protein n=1 Tax=Rodentibacter pneumotropicus TaxID=758 RepID=UPI000988F712|nr:helix-turn-helix transcriptional regulator [Rodentibacter pneumotropicus]OOF67087.1 transcriptional regulator [Rodentibacter pneumotropicus]
MSIDSRLREVMDCKGLNIKTFAELLEVPYRTLQNYLLNERTPNVEVLIKISELLDVDLNWLMCGKGAMFRTHTTNRELTEKEKNLIKHYRMMSEDTQIAFDVTFNILSDTRCVDNTNENI